MYRYRPRQTKPIPPTMVSKTSPSVSPGVMSKSKATTYLTLVLEVSAQTSATLSAGHSPLSSGPPSLATVSRKMIPNSGHSRSILRL